MQANERQLVVIITLKVKLDTDWSVDLEFIDLSTLEDVHRAIQRAVEFDDEHFYEFYVARNQSSRTRTVYDGENRNDDYTRLCDIFPLPAKHYLFYVYDFGASWVFKISRTRKSPFEPIDGVEYPRVVNESGEKPVQYDFEDDD